MKNLILIFTLLTTYVTITAQSNIPNPDVARQHALNSLTKNLDFVVNSKSTLESKKLNLVRVIGHQFSNWHKDPKDQTDIKDVINWETETRTKSKKAFNGKDQRALREMKKFVKDIASVTHGNTTIAHKEMRVMQMAGYYLAQTKVDYSPVDFDSFITGLSNNRNIDQTQVSQYLQVIVAKNTDPHVVPNALRKALGDERTDPNLEAAIRIYEELGANGLGRQDLCEGGKCDKNNAVNVKSRGAATLWQYTGERRFFTDRENYGWRYRCVLVNPNAKRESKTMELAEKDGEKAEEDEAANLEFAWKKDENVDRW